MQIFVNSVKRLNSPIYFASPCIKLNNRSSFLEKQRYDCFIFILILINTICIFKSWKCQNKTRWKSVDLLGYRNLRNLLFYSASYSL